jgi:hypothetical protein
VFITTARRDLFRHRGRQSRQPPLQTTPGDYKRARSSGDKFFMNGEYARLKRCFFFPFAPAQAGVQFFG